MLQQRKQEILDKVETLVEKANRFYKINLPHIDIKFDLRGRNAGIAGYDRRGYYMRFNVDMITNESWNHIINDTVPHELAHIVCFVEPRLGRDHNPGWKSVCRTLGGTGNRTHSEMVTYANGKTFYYTTSTGHVISISSQRHRKVQKGLVYFFRGNKGKISRESPYSTTPPVQMTMRHAVAENTVPPVRPVPPVPPVRNEAPVQRSGSKADQVRAKIRECRAAGLNQTTVVVWAITTLGMSRSLAATYVKNNWNSVV